MLNVIQSNDIHQLFEHLLADYQQQSAQIFDPFVVIVPSKVMGDWLKKQVADQAGISTLVIAEFWGRYQWTLMQQVLQEYARHHPREALRVPEVAVLSKSVMQWRLFGFFNQYKYAILADPTHALYPLLEPLIASHTSRDGFRHAIFAPHTPANTNFHSSGFSPNIFLAHPKSHAELPKWLKKQSFLDKSSKNQSSKPSQNSDQQAMPVRQIGNANHASDEQRLWQLANDMATMLNRYMTYRPAWLMLWSKNTPVNVTQMIAKKDALNQRMAGIIQNTKPKIGQPNDPTQAADPSTFFNNLQTGTPEWLVEHYEQLEIAQRYLWRILFSETYQYRQGIEEQFWHALEHAQTKVVDACRQKLPETLTLFTIQQLPQTELAMMARLAKFIDIKLLHFNPSEMFWADIVDKNWLARQRLINPDSIYFKDYGHTLLSRFGKQSREVFAMLAALSGNDYSETYGNVVWADEFKQILPEKSDTEYQQNEETVPPTLLAQLQQDILVLQEKDTQHASGQAVASLLEQLDNRHYRPERAWHFSRIDNSLSIHACHSMMRQLEVLRSMIIGWLNYVDRPDLLHAQDFEKADTPTDFSDKNSIENAKKANNPNKNKPNKKSNTHQYSLFDAYQDSPPQSLNVKPEQRPHQLTRANRRSLSDILVLLPDIEEQQAVIESIFPKGVGTDGYDLPAKVTGVVSKDINQLWAAITGFYTLLQMPLAGDVTQSASRFERAKVFDWLMLPPLIESYALTHEQMSRGCDLLAMAGFMRGFDEPHLATSLHESDDDYRYSFAYALERLVAGLLMPQAQTAQFGEYVNRYQAVEKILPLREVQLGDSAVIAVLCDIYATIDRNRHVASQSDTTEHWLTRLEDFIHEKFALFEQTNALNSIWAAINAFKKNIQANRRYASYLQADSQTAPVFEQNEHSDNAPLTINVENLNPEKLPLKLGFILTSIEAELASQQVSAEPSGVITFGRIGAVRNLPYKLVVMLNLNLANFPTIDKANRYDLMQAGVSEPGDRFKEDDELGAFLDAILSAKDACWLFYDGASTSDSHEHLPASPVQELIGFLQGEVDWQLSDADAPPGYGVSQNTPKLIQEWLVTKHPALPFAPDYFYEWQPKVASETPAPLLENNSPQSTVKFSTVKPSTVKPSTVKSSAVKQADNDPASDKQAIDANKKTQLSQQIGLIKNAQKSLYPPAPVWHSVFVQLYQRPNPMAAVTDNPNASSESEAKATTKSGKKPKTSKSQNTLNHTLQDVPSNVPRPKIPIWQKSDLTRWLAIWQRQQNDFQQRYLSTTGDNGEPKTHQLLQDFAGVPARYANLSAIIRELQQPAATFIKAQQIHIGIYEKALQNVEPIDLDSLGKYQINAYLLEQRLKTASNRDQPTGRAGKLDTLIFSSQLPAGVSRYASIATQTLHIEQAYQNFWQKLQTIDAVKFPAVARLMATTPAQLADLVTPCTEQRLAVHIALSPSHSASDVSSNDSSKNDAALQSIAWQTCVITASLPMLPRDLTSQATSLIEKNGQVDSGQSVDCGYWINYLPTSGREKYQLQFWLSHLCWQVARHTSPQQVVSGHGFSLWQFSNQHTWYLPPIAHEQAYLWLQDWLMVWQLCRETVVVMPPSVLIALFRTMAADRQKGDTKSLWQYINTHWKNENHSEVYDHHANHVYWQFLLQDYDIYQAIMPFISTLGERLYYPLLNTLVAVE